MKTLEESAKQDNMELFFAENSSELMIGLSNFTCGLTTSVSEISMIDAMKEARDTYRFVTPNLTKQKQTNDIVEYFLKSGFPLGESVLDVELEFNYDKGLGRYISILKVQNSDWIQYVKDNPGKPSFSREIGFGYSENNFEEAYKNMGKDLRHA